MAHVRIEINRGNGWQVRQESDCAIDREGLLALVTSYTIGYPHRFYIDGEILGEFKPRGKLTKGARGMTFIKPNGEAMTVAEIARHPVRVR